MTKKIILLYDYLAEFGGLERMMFRHADWLNKDYNPVLAFASVNKKTEAVLRRDFSLEENIPIIEFSRIKLNEVLKVFSLIFSRKRIIKEKPDLLISFSFLCSYLCHKIKKKYNIPYYMVMCHPPNFLYFDSFKDRLSYINNVKRLIAAILGFFFSPILKHMDKVAVKNANKVFPISDYTRRRAISIYGNKDYLILYPPIADTFKQLDKERLKLFIEKYNLKNPFVYTTGRIIPDKKFEWIIEAYNKMPDRKYDLIISGMITERYKKQLQDLINKLALKDKARILGPIPKEDLIALYNLASVFVISAPKEDFGLVPLEAIACGTPVVAWNDNAGPNETITNGTTGFLAQPYNTEELAKAITKTAELRNNNKNFERYIEKFRTKAVKSKLLNSIKEII